MRRAAVLFSLLGILACDGGLEPPPPVEPGFSGVVHFTQGTWPSADSLAQIQLWIFASQNVPHDSASIVNGILVAPFTIYLYPSLSVSLPKGIDSLSYTFRVPAATYQYVGVLQHYGTDLTISSFEVVGVYQNAENPGIPRPVAVNEFETSSGIDMYVDFHHPPPQPF